MAKIDYSRYTLPDIEMYGGSTDAWNVELYWPDMRRHQYEDLKSYTFKLIIKDYGYTHRENGTTLFELEKTGTIAHEDNGDAFVDFKFEKADTFNRRGKFVYQIEASWKDNYYVAQGNLFITKNIDQ